MNRSLGILASRRSCRVLSVVWALATAALLLFPGSELPGAEFPGFLVTGVELSIHLALFFGLAWLASRGFAGQGGLAQGSTSQTVRRQRVLAVVSIYCVLLEIAQIAVPGRGFEFIDIAAGLLGAFLGLGRRD